MVMPGRDLVPVLENLADRETRADQHAERQVTLHRRALAVARAVHRQCHQPRAGQQYEGVEDAKAWVQHLARLFEQRHRLAALDHEQAEQQREQRDVRADEEPHALVTGQPALASDVVRGGKRGVRADAPTAFPTAAASPALAVSPRASASRRLMAENR
jgi:hypothetical protein